MKLKTIKIRNFRGYKNETEVHFDDLTSFIGKNDAGKSTILEALEIFFNNTLVVCEKEDLSIQSEDSDIEISCIFSELPESIVIDSSSVTSLENEYLLNQDNLLEIKKVYKATASKPKAQVYIVCKHPSTSPFDDLLSKKIMELRTIATDLNIDNDTYSASSSVSLRAAIWREMTEENLQVRSLLVDKEDTKKVFSSLEKYLPIYSLFQSIVLVKIMIKKLPIR